MIYFTNGAPYFTHKAERYVERFMVTPCSEKLVTTHNNTATHPRRPRPQVFFTLRRLNSPRITIEQRETIRVNTLKWERCVLRLVSFKPAANWKYSLKKTHN